MATNNSIDIPEDDTMTFYVLGEKVSIPVADLAGLEVILDQDFWAFLEGDMVITSNIFTLELQDKIKKLEDQIDNLEIVIANLDKEVNKLKGKADGVLPLQPFQIQLPDPGQLEFDFGFGSGYITTDNSSPYWSQLISDYDGDCWAQPNELNCATELYSVDLTENES